ncbi:MAG: NUDIX domain-containing protein [Nitrososphaerales archaeon]|nr:NUDIX domain-containing protein [Nitrososphaerales archaeon]
MTLRRLRVKEQDKKLPDGFYRAHLRHFPVVTVDLVVTDRESRVLLVKRSSNNLNWKGAWATPGGRVYRNETIREAASRVLAREAGIGASPQEFAFKGVGEIVTSKEHGVTIVFAINRSGGAASADETSSSVRWFEPARLPKTLKDEYRSILSKGGVGPG